GAARTPVARTGVVQPPGAAERSISRAVEFIVPDEMPAGSRCHARGRSMDRVSESRKQSAENRRGSKGRGQPTQQLCAHRIPLFPYGVLCSRTRRTRLATGGVLTPY